MDDDSGTVAAPSMPHAIVVNSELDQPRPPRAACGGRAKPRHASRRALATDVTVVDDTWRRSGKRDSDWLFWITVTGLCSFICFLFISPSVCVYHCFSFLVRYGIQRTYVLGCAFDFRKCVRAGEDVALCLPSAFMVELI